MRISITIEHTYRYGMAITATTSVLTGDDWKYAKDIQPGDWVFNRLGKPVKVKMAQIYRSEDCRRVTFGDYLTVEGDGHLAFPIETPTDRIVMRKYQGVKKRRVKQKFLNCTQMLEQGLDFRRNEYRFSVATTHPIELPHQPLEIPPFLFGFWFISRKWNKTLTVPHEFKDRVFQSFKDAGYKVTEKGLYTKNYIRFVTEPSIWSQLAGRIPTKMPLSYLNGSAEQRLDLICGILCAKPIRKATKLGCFSFKTKKKHISLTFQYLSESLGATACPTLDTYGNTYNLSVMRLPSFIPEMAPPRPFTHYARRYVKSIEPIPAQLCVHIETDDEDGSFLTGEGFIPCH